VGRIDYGNPGAGTTRTGTGGSGYRSVEYRRLVYRLFPLTFHLQPEADPGSILKSVKEQLRQVPNGGIGYGILRYLDDRKPEAENLNCRPPVIFNYLGIQNPPASDMLGNVQMVFSGARDPQSERYSLLEINALVLEGRLNMRWSYSRRLYRPDTVNRLIGTFEKTLRRLIDYCVAIQNSDYTPSDFPDADLSQEDLDHLLGQIEQ
jgi:non-ribosomal peptide synthase protein (TIGR01720 family)